ncbi:aspartic peptidase A1 [Mycena belliarum]|uniref:Aspartic peptidase A1 n=1 Tax=Mycena belliarum TaxID=1033014 RepID=A0AAD6XLM2_9AGAR|nr:aspartic peptidase A1 [Mycena belliae]
MHSLIPLSLILAVSDVVYAVKLPFYVRTSSTAPERSVGRRAVPISNNGNAEYMSNITLGGTTVSVILDTGSSDLWVNFPKTTPPTKDLGKSLSLSYAVGSASGTVKSAQLQFDGFTVEDQAFLLVPDRSSFSKDTSFDGLLGLGPNEGSVIHDKLDSAAGDSMINRIFSQNKSASNYITFLLDRKNDPGETLTGQFTIGETVKGFENITAQPKLNVKTVHKLLEDQQHWQAMTDKDKTLIGPDGNYINIKSIVPRAPKGQLVAVFDSGFTFSQVPREMSDAIYGRVQGAVYDPKNEWWTVPCGQMLNLTFSFGGVAFPINPLDTVDDNFKIMDSTGNRVCIGAFQPITSAFSLFGNFDMIMGMTFLRNAYTLMDFGDWIDSSSVDRGDPFIQLLPLTNVAAAHAGFVKQRLAGVDTSGASQYQLLPASQQQHSPVSDSEKKAKYEEMILSRWPYIFVGCLVAVALLVGFIVWRCCCRRKGKQGKAAAGAAGFFPQKTQAYHPLQVQGGGAPPPSGYGNQGGYANQQTGYGFQQAGYGNQQGGYNGGHGYTG